jgi:hypothetical protein
MKAPSRRDGYVSLFSIGMGLSTERREGLLKRGSHNANAEVNNRLADQEQRTVRLGQSHQAFSHNTRLQLRQVLEAVRELTMPPDPPKRAIGFMPPAEKPTGGKAARTKKQG